MFYMVTIIDVKVGGVTRYRTDKSFSHFKKVFPSGSDDDIFAYS